MIQFTKLPALPLFACSRGFLGWVLLHIQELLGLFMSDFTLVDGKAPWTGGIRGELTILGVCCQEIPARCSWVGVSSG